MRDVQDRPPVFQGSFAAVINEDSPIGTLVMTIHARDGDHGQPRKIVYDLLTSTFMPKLLLQHNWNSMQNEKCNFSPILLRSISPPLFIGFFHFNSFH